MYHAPVLNSTAASQIIALLAGVVFLYKSVTGGCSGWIDAVLVISLRVEVQGDDGHSGLYQHLVGS
jgi:membrane associated rhomboid family serine protease